MPKIRKQYQKGFTTIDNTPINDEKLTWKAKGLFVYLWSKPDDWDYRVTEVARHAKDGVGSTSTGVTELEEAGYLKRSQENNHGVFGDSVWTLSEKPIFKNPRSDNPLSEKPYTDNCTLLNTDPLNTNKTNKRVTKDNGQARPDDHLAEQCREVIVYLNEKANKDYRPNAKANRNAIYPRLKEGYTVAKLKKVIDNKVADWKGVTFEDGRNAENYLRPETLFRASKIEGYLNEKPAANPNDYHSAGYYEGWNHVGNNQPESNQPSADSVGTDDLPF